MDGDRFKGRYKYAKHVGRQIKDSKLLNGNTAAQDEYVKWNAKLEAEGLRAYDNEYRGASAYATSKTGDKEAAGSSKFEYFEVLRDYCRYNHYELQLMLKMPVKARQHFKQMLSLFANGLSMPEAYKIVKANRVSREKMFTAIYFYKKFQEAKDEYLSQFQEFSEYLQYRKYELGTALSYPAWLAREGLQRQ